VLLRVDEDLPAQTGDLRGGEVAALRLRLTVWDPLDVAQRVRRRQLLDHQPGVVRRVLAGPAGPAVRGGARDRALPAGRDWRDVPLQVGHLPVAEPVPGVVVVHGHAPGLELGPALRVVRRGGYGLVLEVEVAHPLERLDRRRLIDGAAGAVLVEEVA